jgi:decaprenylphospho-beta-D-erythro-pentofuranosid-2-ulose 2-reductase
MQRILLIGATSSVASSLARRYKAQGAQFYFLARSEEKLRSLVSEMGGSAQADGGAQAGGSVIGSELVDFLDYERSGAAVKLAFERAGWFDLVLIAHGYLGDQLKSEDDFAEALNQVSVNYLSVVAQLIALSAELERCPDLPMHIAVLTSVAGDRGRPRNYTYGSAKGALSLYLEGLRSRLWKRATITTIKLGPVDSPMTVNHEKNALFVSTESAAAGIERAIRKKRAVAYVPTRWWFIMWVVKLMPEWLFQRIPSLSGR